MGKSIGKGEPAWSKYQSSGLRNSAMGRESVVFVFKSPGRPAVIEVEAEQHQVRLCLQAGLLEKI